MRIFVTLFEGTIGNYILLNGTITNTNVAPHGLRRYFSDFDSLTRDNTLVSFLRSMAVVSCCSLCSNN